MDRQWCVKRVAEFTQLLSFLVESVVFLLDTTLPSARFILHFNSCEKVRNDVRAFPKGNSRFTM